MKNDSLTAISQIHFAKTCVALLVALLVPLCFARASDIAANRQPSPATAAPFRLFSGDIRNGARLPEAQVFNENGYHGENVSPQLAWSGAPVGTKSFVITLFDPDAPSGHGWWHWAVIDIPANVFKLPRGAGSGKALLPKSAQTLRNDFGNSRYDGAAPPPGKPHRYIFTIYALSVAKLPAASDSSAAQLSKILRGKILYEAKITTTYGKR